ncbi:predicted protein [Arabidopsis lyrata subsp. lyrata]|uniref:Predicted protein n=1 Tax=Arabidopsis lyrata subsp. lyrata TaxID=81972 RepID=D7KHI1_ARALL|nr:predicted protein [Arabidopsis lyrata subsp. lyrata]
MYMGIRYQSNCNRYQSKLIHGYSQLDKTHYLQTFPYLVRKFGANELMQNFPLQPLTFARNTHVAQASDIANSGMLALYFLEAHATGGISKVYLVQESGMRERAEQLAVEMYEHEK